MRSRRGCNALHRTLDARRRPCGRVVAAVVLLDVVVADKVFTATKRAADEGWYGLRAAGGSASAGRGAAITISTSVGSHVQSAFSAATKQRRTPGDGEDVSSGECWK